MAVITKKDKKIWENYVTDFENFTLNTSNNNLIKVNKSKKKINENDIRSNHFKMIKKGKIKPDSIIDLHGYTLNNAKSMLQKHFKTAFEKNIRTILIITGKGHNNLGVLKKEIPILLNNNVFKKYLISFDIAPKSFGGEGALLVRIRNKYKELN